MSESPPRENGEKRAKLFEDIFIILCILCLWPSILRWHNPFYEYLLYVALTGLVVIFFRRLRRFRQARDEMDG